MSVKGKEEERGRRGTLLSMMQVSHLCLERGKEGGLAIKNLRLQHNSEKVWPGWWWVLEPKLHVRGVPGVQDWAHTISPAILCHWLSVGLGKCGPNERSSGSLGRQWCGFQQDSWVHFNSHHSGYSTLLFQHFYFYSYINLSLVHYLYVTYYLFNILISIHILIYCLPIIYKSYISNISRKPAEGEYYMSNNYVK